MAIASGFDNKTEVAPENNRFQGMSIQSPQKCMPRRQDRALFNEDKAFGDYFGYFGTDIRAEILISPNSGLPTPVSLS